MPRKKGLLGKRRKYWYNTPAAKARKKDANANLSRNSHQSEGQKLYIPAANATLDHNYMCLETESRETEAPESENSQPNNSANEPLSDLDNNSLTVSEEECYSYIAANEEVSVTSVNKSDAFKREINQMLSSKFDNIYILNWQSDRIQIVELYPSKDKVSVKLNVTIDQNFRAKIFVHMVQVDDDHDFWLGLPQTFDTIKSVERLLAKLQLYTVCVGNCDEEYQSLLPMETAILETSSGVTGYREGNIGAVKGDLQYTSTVRNTKCKLLVYGARCSPCSSLRSILRSRMMRQKEREKQMSDSGQEPNYMTTAFRHTSMTKDQLIGKIKQQQSKIKSLQYEVNRIQRQFDKELRSQGVDISECQSMELRDAMATCTHEMEKAFPDANSFQRLFWMQQFKSLNVKSSKGMRWHPMILRWCLYLRHQSNAAYETLRESGFVTLPSTRTLFDYSHYIRSGNGFQSDIIDVLKGEATKRGMYDEKEPWRNYVGIIFDEIKIKADLVYDKHSGELIGYCNLDKVGNQIMDFEKHCKESVEADIAKYMLVVMVRGVTSDLKFPLAGFTTTSITADFLYPIVWKAVRILETSKARLRVLFITCDGASANRRFFKLHGSVNQFIHFTSNPYASDGRNVKNLQELLCQLLCQQKYTKNVERWERHQLDAHS